MAKMSKCKIAKLEVERQLKVANEYAVGQKDWKRVNKEWKNLIGAYHQGRKEALEDILSKLDGC